MNEFDEFDKDEKEIAGILKKIDFSRQSARHRNELWRELSRRRELSRQSGARLLSDDELEIAAAGPGEPLNKKDMD